MYCYFDMDMDAMENAKGGDNAYDLLEGVHFRLPWVLRGEPEAVEAAKNFGRALINCLVRVTNKTPIRRNYSTEIAKVSFSSFFQLRCASVIADDVSTYALLLLTPFAEAPVCAGHDPGRIHHRPAPYLARGPSNFSWASYVRDTGLR